MSIGLHDCEDNIGFVSDVLESDGGDHHHHEVEDPVTARIIC